MTSFIDGPAKGQTLMLRRSPMFLRVVRDPAGKWDALDQLRDTPGDDESIVAYKRVEKGGMVHIDFTRKRSGWFSIAKYAVIDPQPNEAEMRSTTMWRMLAQELKARGQKGGAA